MFEDYQQFLWFGNELAHVLLSSDLISEIDFLIDGLTISTVLSDFLSSLHEKNITKSNSIRINFFIISRFYKDI